MISRSLGRALLLGTLAGISALTAQAPAEATPEAVVKHHATWCHDLYARVEALALELQDRIDELIAAPSAETLAAAREAWLAARAAYGMTEALRFHDGPIEPLEPLLNAWPVDEAYIDSVEGQPDSGIINDPEQFPNLRAAILVLANERGGEANICVGWHAIEFVLWGQDLSSTGPGDRPYTDFQAGVGRNAERRCDYLRAITGLLVDHLGQLRAAWAPGAPYRERFESEVDASVRRMLVGVTVLSAFELGGERMVVAYETRDQEQEHSCFSDNSWQDFVSNQAGLRAVVLGCEVDGTRGPGLIELIRTREPNLARALQAGLDKTTEALAAIPQPFDQAFLGEDDSAGRQAMGRAIACLEQQTELLLFTGKELGHDLPLEPGG